MNLYASFLTGMSDSSKEKVVGFMTEVLLTMKETPSKRMASQQIMEKAKDWFRRNRNDKAAVTAFLHHPKDVDNDKAIVKMLQKRFGFYFSRDCYYILSYDPDAVFPKIRCPILAVLWSTRQPYELSRGERANGSSRRPKRH
ncbi:hypothetical protein [Parapedobacter composti]|uniref:hypothetical protein n=1 Tax=Parapedobacter composti TaxID=623281 RepID=UPI001113DA54|nr:hypothetical protein [Parapedobacter composti]